MLSSLPGDGYVLAGGDLADPEAVRAMVDGAADALGSIDVLVDNAGVGGWRRASPRPTWPRRRWRAPSASGARRRARSGGSPRLRRSPRSSSSPRPGRAGQRLRAGRQRPRTCDVGIAASRCRIAASDRGGGTGDPASACWDARPMPRILPLLLVLAAALLAPARRLADAGLSARPASSRYLDQRSAAELVISKQTGTFELRHRVQRRLHPALRPQADPPRQLRLRADRRRGVACDPAAFASI